MATGKNRYKEININKKKDKTSVLSIDASGCFSSIGVAGEEIETLLSSRSFSYDSSCEFSHSMDRIAGKSDYRTFNRPTGNKVSKLNKIKKTRTPSFIEQVEKIKDFVVPGDDASFCVKREGN
jgi:hypothetical protein